MKDCLRKLNHLNHDLNPISMYLNPCILYGR